MVGENALARCIRAARSAVGDDGVKQEIIATQHGRGYRFVALRHHHTALRLESSVQSLESENHPASPEAVQALDPRLSDCRLSDPRRPTLVVPSAQRSWSSRGFVLAGVLLLVGIIVMVQYLSPALT